MRGLHSFVLGGGYAAGDGLFRCERDDARGGKTLFKMLALTHDAAAAEFERARAAFDKRAGKDWSPRPDFFPAYRG